MNWNYASLPFARKDTVDLYVREDTGVVEVLVGSAKDGECYFAERLLGRLACISLDQRGAQVPWSFISLPAFCRSPEIDARRAETIPGHEPTLDSLAYPIANAMNRTMKDRGFSRFVKKSLVGSWLADGSVLNFTTDGNYSIVGSFKPARFPPPTTGRWYTGGRMLCMMNEANDKGIREAIVSVGERELRFHGRDGALFHVYERA